MRRPGPGLLVAAAFIGPGTITTASLAGAGFGLALLWALVFSIVTTMVLQEMAARLGIVARRGLSEALRESLALPWLRGCVMALIVAAIGIGNAAYEAGNILGAAIGAGALLALPQSALVVAIAGVAGGLLWSGRYRLLETVLVGLVALMGVVFLLAMAMNPPDVSLLFVVPDAAAVDRFWLTALALVGTTVVPYNLFLHASAVQVRWPATAPVAVALSEARRDGALSIGLGGVLTLAVMSTAAVAFHGSDVELSAATMAAQLEPVLGPFAGTCFALGLLAAGLTSAITAPLAAAWAVCGACGWPTDLRAPRFRAIWMLVLGTGVLFALLQSRPIAAIVFAQAANGLLLPVIAVALLWVMNRSALLGAHRNGLFSNCLAAAVALVAVVLGGNRLLALLG